MFQDRNDSGFDRSSSCLEGQLTLTNLTDFDISPSQNITFLPPADDVSEALQERLSKINLSYLFDQGTAKTAEDRIIVKPPFIAVLDGTSGVFYPGLDRIMYPGNRSGGQFAGDIIAATMAQASSVSSLLDLLAAANQTLATEHVKLNLPLEQPGRLAGVAGVIIKIEVDEISIAQWADCYNCIFLIDGTIRLSQNQVYQHDLEMRKLIADLMNKHAANRNEMWREFGPILLEKRNARINCIEDAAGYGFLCGAENFLKCVNFTSVRFEPANAGPILDRLALFTDGLIYFPETADSDNVVGNMLQPVNEFEGTEWLRAVLHGTRQAEFANKEISHISHAECAAIMLKIGQETA